MAGANSIAECCSDAAIIQGDAGLRPRDAPDHKHDLVSIDASRYAIQIHLRAAETHFT